jgi:hypothetical protein
MIDLFTLVTKDFAYLNLASRHYITGHFKVHILYSFLSISLKKIVSPQLMNLLCTCIFLSRRGRMDYGLLVTDSYTATIT